MSDVKPYRPAIPQDIRDECAGRTLEEIEDKHSIAWQHWNQLQNKDRWTQQDYQEDTVRRRRYEHLANIMREMKEGGAK